MKRARAHTRTPPPPPILTFAGEHRWLSNFFPAPVAIVHPSVPNQLHIAATVEHAYQASKAVDVRDFTRIIDAATPGEAKRLGRRILIVPGWNGRKLELMHRLLQLKFSGHLGAQLVATHPRELVEGNTWGDTFWGVCRGVGRNELGKLLMRVRDELRSASGS